MPSAREQEASFKNTIGCALDRVLPVDEERPSTLAARRRAGFTLDFIYSRLYQKFTEYNIQTPIERIHFLSQILHETGYFMYTVEKVGRSTWRRVFDAADSLGRWNCTEYLGAINRNKRYFDERYAYKAKFRGRGLIQLTTCNNYLNFFFKKAVSDRIALEGSDPELNRLANTAEFAFNYFDSRERKIGIKYNDFCTDEMLQRIAEFDEWGFPFRPPSISSDFENTVNELALPCTGRGFYEMESVEFLVDTAVNYWKKCQKSSIYSPHLRDTSDKAIALVSECVHGSSRGLYRTFDESSCDDDKGVPTSDALNNIQDTNKHWVLQRYCSRRHNFKRIQGCFL